MTEAIQTLEPPTHRYKRGDVREDGKIFFRYLKGKEYWCTEDQFNKCKNDEKEGLARYRSNNKERIRRAEKLNRKHNIETAREQERKYYINNKERINLYGKQWRQNNKERINKKKKEWLDRNRDKVRSKNKEYRQKKKCELSRNTCYVEKKSQQNHALLKLSKSIRSSIKQALRKKGYTKKSRTHEILGCSFEFFKNHIEQRFQEGMTWENRSEWHLDHIIPVSSGKTEKEILKLNHYSNFRPLWAKDNLAKGKRQNKQLELITGV
jgi:hypothetical protein